MKVLKAVIGGGLLGAAFFFIPFIVMRILLFMILIGFIFRLLGRSRWGRRGFDHHGFGRSKEFAFADYIRGMSDEEYNRFRQHFGNNRRGAAVDNNTTEPNSSN